MGDETENYDVKIFRKISKKAAATFPDTGNKIARKLKDKGDII